MLWYTFGWGMFLMAGIFADIASGKSEVGIAVYFFGLGLLGCAEGICGAIKHKGATDEQ